MLSDDFGMANEISLLIFGIEPRVEIEFTRRLLNELVTLSENKKAKRRNEYA